MFSLINTALGQESVHAVKKESSFLMLPGTLLIVLIINFLITIVIKMQSSVWLRSISKFKLDVGRPVVFVEKEICASKAMNFNSAKLNQKKRIN